MPQEKQLIKQDLNFLEYPLWFQNERLPEGFIWKDRDGFIYRAGYKPPVRIDALYLCYFLMESQRNNWSTHIVVSQRSAMNACGVQPGKTNALRLHDSCERWINITLSFQGTFYNGQQYEKLQFNVINEWYKERISRYLEVDLNKFFIEKTQYSKFSKFLDLNILRKLKLPLAMRLYEILLKNFMYRDEWSIDAHKLASKIPMAKKYLSEILERLRKALQQINTYTELMVQMTVEPYARGKAVLHFKKLKKDPVAISDEQENSSITLVDSQGVPVQNQVAADIQELFDRVPQEHREKRTIRNTIEDACKKYGARYVLRNIKYTNSHCKKNYRAFLIKALENDWGLELQEDEEARKEILQKEAEKARKEQELYEHKKRVQAYIQNLSAKDRQKLEMQAKSEIRKDIQGKDASLARMLILSQMEAIISRKFEEKKPA